VPRDSRYDILFEPVRIGPVTARNRFFQVPHCNGMGYVRPQSHAAMRGIKAEGGWAVVSTEEVEIHPTSDLAPYVEGRLWDDKDIPAFALMTDAIHRHGSLAAIELAHGGMNAGNLFSREISMAPSHIANPESYNPAQSRAMRRCGRAAPASMSSMSMRATDCPCRCIFCNRVTTSAPTNMAAVWKIARGCCAN
jgi:dimethylamine/trimethylamine dehydrogenase